MHGRPVAQCYLARRPVAQQDVAQRPVAQRNVPQQDVVPAAFGPFATPALPAPFGPFVATGDALMPAHMPNAYGPLGYGPPTGRKIDTSVGEPVLALRYMHADALAEAHLNGRGVKIGIIDCGYEGAPHRDATQALVQNGQIGAIRDFVDPATKTSTTWMPPR